MSSVARDFMDAASRTFLGYSAEGKQLMTIFVPAIACYAFATEIHLKVIHHVNGKNVRGHDLAKLFKELPSAVKAELRRRVARPDDEFVKQLARIAGAFVDWRYIYESPRSLNFKFLQDFASATQSFALELAPVPPPKIATVTFG